MYSVHTEIKFTLKPKTVIATETNIKKQNQFPSIIKQGGRRPCPTRRSDEHWLHPHWLFGLLLKTETVCIYFKAGSEGA